MAELDALLVRTPDSLSPNTPKPQPTDSHRCVFSISVLHPLLCNYWMHTRSMRAPYSTANNSHSERSEKSLFDCQHSPTLYAVLYRSLFGFDPLNAKYNI